MAGWSEILAEIQIEQDGINTLLAQNPNDPAGRTSGADIVRKRYVAALAQYTDRNVIVYASGWLQKPQVPAEILMVHPNDLDGFLETVHGCDYDKGLDLILHSPGGVPEAAEQIVKYLRSKFAHIRVFVPHMAMSAATMMACAANSIVLACHSTLGPTDPQIPIRTNTGEMRLVAAHALLQDFSDAKQTRGVEYAAWAPILGQYPPGLLTECRRSLSLTKELVTTWLAQYMFAGKRNRRRLAINLAKFLADSQHHSHARPLMRDELRIYNMQIEDLEDDQQLQDLVMSVYHATTHTLGGTAAAKIIDNHLGHGFVRIFQQVQLPLQPS
jgi:hypothetical protein